MWGNTAMRIGTWVKAIGNIRPRAIYGLFCLMFSLFGGVSVHAADVPQNVQHQGQAATLLTDGEILLTGGLEQGKALSAVYLLAPNGTIRKLDQGLLSPRTDHTATALPDGTVLIFGGTDGSGHYLRSMEIYNPRSSQFTAWSGFSLVPRTRHTATLLTSGVVLIVGGTGEGSTFPTDIQIWDFRTGVIKTVDRGPIVQRQGQTAELLANGEVSITGGLDQRGRPVKYAELYDPETQSFQVVGENPVANLSQQSSISLAASIPLDGATQYPIADFLKFRFSRPVDWTTVTSANVSLQSSTGTTVTATVAMGEEGRLAFLIPSSPLLANTDYVSTLNGLRDLSGSYLQTTVLHFHTEGIGGDGSDDDWIPSQAALNGNFQTGTGESKWQKLPPLKASAGITAISGQVLGVSGNPIPHVTLQIDQHKVETDGTGRFLLTGVAPGRQVLIIDGSTAKRAAAEYGFFETAVDVQAGATTVLNYTIWLTKLDTAHAVHIPSPTTAADTVITTPRLPGLELHLPAGTRIIDRNGKPINELTITPVPLDKPPFPLPTGLRVPLYFTIQPGGAEIRILGSGATLKGARLFYPNSYHEPSGTLYNFWNYDATSKGWYIYGNGHVLSSKTQIEPDPGVFVYELTGAMVGGGSAKNGVGPGPDGSSDGDPVDLSSGQFVYTKSDLIVPDVLPIQLTRTYTTNDHYQRPFGIGASDNYDIFMVGDTNPYTYQELIQPNGASIRFNRTSAGTSNMDAVYASTALGGPWYGATLFWNNGQLPISGAAWVLKTRTGLMFGFPDGFLQNDQLHQALIGIQDPHGNRVILTRDANSRLTKITSPSGRYISLTYDASGRISQSADNAGRTVSYSYDGGGRVATVTDVNGGVTTLAYNSSDQMTTITDARNILYLANQYDSFGRVTKQTQADGSTYLFSWTTSPNISQQWAALHLPVDRYNSSDYEGYTGLISQVDVTDPRGYVRRVSFDNLGRTTSDTRALGQPEQQTMSYLYYADNLLKSVTDPLGRISTYDYDAAGDLTTATKLSGTANAVTSTMAYDPSNSQLLTVTDPLNHTTTFSYDAQGDVIQIKDPLGHQRSFAYDASGNKIAATDSLDNTVTLGYIGPDLTSITDPLGNSVSRLTDNMGRLVTTVDALGNSERYQYDAGNQVVSVTNAQHQQANYSYDANGNLTSVDDYRGNSTQYTYDQMDRRITRKDPLLRNATITYDLAGNPVSETDPKGQVTSRTFDGLGRIVFIGYGKTTGGSGATYQSSVSFTYDAGNRLISAVDSLAGTFSRTHDGLDRLTSETTPQGSISYTYDAAGRRITAQTGTGALTTYMYDDANRLLSVAQGPSSAVLSYDDANRRTSMTLPNGVATQYGYDQASHLQSIVYSVGSTTIGNLSYAYDADGHRTDVTGTLTRTGLPATMTTASYDAANQLTSWGGVSLTYDSNGNTLTDISGNSYTWNDRNQLSSITGIVDASFAYDPYGRRVGRTIGLQAASYQFDGLNRITETTGGSSTVSLAGGMDEYFSRTNTSATYPLVDALGSTVALTDASGSVATSYSYDPFGATVIAGAASDNGTQFTGRENDGTGLYFYRARYYNPQTGRFISQDPLGFGGGSFSFYRYANDNPVMLRDPSGKCPNCVIGAGVGFLAYALTHRKNFEWGGALAWAGYGALAGSGVGLLADGLSLFGAEAAAEGALAGGGEGALAGEGAEAGIGDAAGACCFAAGTPVHTKRGLVAIEKVRIGDFVLSENPKNGTTEYKKVTALVPAHLDTLLQLEIEGDSQVLQPSLHHPFFVKRANIERGSWIEADAMKPGDLVLTLNGRWEKVKSLGDPADKQLVYNLTVEGDHDFYVGNTGYLVHNSACDIARAAASDFTPADGMCKECAQAIQNALQDNGYGGDLVNITGEGDGNIMSDLYPSDSLTTNGDHWGVITDNGTYFDNFFQNGVPWSDFLNSLQSPWPINPPVITPFFPPLF